MKQLIVAVLGMHRSGTSCLTGLLIDAGFFLGDVQKKNPHNPKGNQENRRFMELHDCVLADNGANWRHPPDTLCVWSQERQQELAELVNEYRSSGTLRWALKDPRLLFLLEEWERIIPDIKYIATIRHPLAVAGSLNRRSAISKKQATISIEEGLDLWHTYNARLLRHREITDFPIINFDLPEDAYLEKVVLGLRSLGVDADTNILNFFSSELRHDYISRNVDSDLPGNTRILYGKLKELAG